jgi:hypothetical protein
MENTPSLRGQYALLESLVESGLPTSDSEQLATHKAEEAHLLQDGITALESGESPDSPAGSLVRLVLKERLEQTIQLALLAIEPLHDADTIRIIRAGFASGERRHIENAIELLGNIEGSNAIKLLMQVLTRIYDHQQAPHTAEISTVKDIIEWCTTHPDKWLQQCAGYFMQEIEAGGVRV